MTNLQQQTIFDTDTRMALDQEVDAFWAATPQRAPAMTICITCRVCNKPAEIPITASGLLCDLCRVDLATTETHIRDTLATAEQTLTDAWTRWDADLAHSGEADWWARVSAAQIAVEQGQMTRAEFDRKVATTIKQGGIRATLWAQSQAIEALVRATETTRAWAEAALEEVRAAQ